MTTLREVLHQILDTIPEEQLLEARALLLTFVQARLGRTVSWEAFNRARDIADVAEKDMDLDTWLQDDAELRSQLAESVEEIQSEVPLVDQQTLRRLVNMQENGRR